MQETKVQFLGWEDPLKKEMATHSSILAWEIPWTEELVGSSAWGCQRVRHNLATKQQQQVYMCQPQFPSSSHPAAPLMPLCPSVCVSISALQIHLDFLGFSFFLMCIFLKDFIEFVTILLLFDILIFWPWGIWDLSFPIRDWTHTRYIRRQSLSHWTAREVPLPRVCLFFVFFLTF